MTNILLTATETSPVPSIVSYVVGIIIIALMGYYIYSKYKTDPDGEEKLKEFLEGIQSIVKEHIMIAIDSFDFLDASDSFAVVQAEFLDNVYEDIWNLCTDEIDELVGKDDLLYTLLKKTITKDKVKEYVLTLFEENSSIQEKLYEVYNIALKDKMEAIAEEDKKLEEEANAYENDEVEVEEVPELDPTKLPEADEDPIIPPVDEEPETVSADDPTVEVIETEEIDLDAAETE